MKKIFISCICLLINACSLSNMQPQPTSCEQLLKIDWEKYQENEDIIKMQKYVIPCKEIEIKIQEINTGITQKENSSDLEIKYQELKNMISMIHSSLQQGTSHRMKKFQKNIEILKKQQLFDGYQNTRFGMSKEMVKSHFKGRLIQKEKNYLKYRVNGAEIIFWFFNDELNQVEVSPNVHKKKLPQGQAWEDMKNTLNAMILKYGTPEIVPGMVKKIGFFTFPLVYYKWQYKDKEITMSHHDLGWFAEGIRDDASSEHQTIKIIYKDLKRLKEKKEFEERKEAQLNYNKASQKAQELRNVI